MAEPVNKWKLDKHIPVAVIVTVIAAAVSGIIIVNTNTRDIERTRMELLQYSEQTNKRIEKLEERTDKFTELLVRIDERLKAVVDELTKEKENRP